MQLVAGVVAGRALAGLGFGGRLLPFSSMVSSFVDSGMASFPFGECLVQTLVGHLEPSDGVGNWIVITICLSSTDSKLSRVGMNFSTDLIGKPTKQNSSPVVASDFLLSFSGLRSVSFAYPVVVGDGNDEPCRPFVGAIEIAHLEDMYFVPLRRCLSVALCL